MMNRPTFSTIEARSSWRSYRDEPLTPDQRQTLREAIDAVPTPPFGAPVRPVLVEGVNTDGRKLGTYGVIKGARHYLVGVVERYDHDLEDLGHVLEGLILVATELGLGTCWLGGTLDREAFGKAVDVGPSEWVPAVTPVGPRADRRRLVDATVRRLAGSRKRKRFEELFFAGDFESPLSSKKAGAWRRPLEAVRIGPSASNKQPWRFLLDDDGLHLFLQPTPGYGRVLGFEIQRIDMGIAMCHLEIVAREDGLDGTWQQAPPDVPAPEGARYVASWRR